MAKRQTTPPTAADSSGSDTDRNRVGGSGDDSNDADTIIKQPRLWRDNGWTARVIKNDDDEGWAVAMLKDGEAEPALVGPWTMGRDKKNPKPLDTAAFNTLVKTASEVIRRHEQHLQATLHKRLPLRSASGGDGGGHGGGANAVAEVALDIVPDDDDPHAVLTAFDTDGAVVATRRVRADFRFTTASASAWVEGGCGDPG